MATPETMVAMDAWVKKIHRAFLYVVILAVVCVSALSYALFKANDTIYKLSSDLKCRSEAASAESGALIAFLGDVGYIVTQSTPATDDQKETLRADLDALAAAHRARTETASGCP